MAVLQVIDTEGEGHNYRDKTIMGHEGRTKDEDVNEYYDKSIFVDSGE